MKKLNHHKCNLSKCNHSSQKFCQNIPVSVDTHRKEWDVILHVGISPTEKIEAASEMTEVMKDLSAQAHFLCHWYTNFHHVHTV